MTKSCSACAVTVDGTGRPFFQPLTGQVRLRLVQADPATGVPIPSYISAVLRGEQPRPLHADDRFDCRYAPDAGRAIALLMTAETLRHGTYNVSSGRPAANREFADALEATTPGLHLGLLPGRQEGPREAPYLDITRLTQDTGFVPGGERQPVTPRQQAHPWPSAESQRLHRPRNWHQRHPLYVGRHRNPPIYSVTRSHTPGQAKRPA